MNSTVGERGQITIPKTIRQHLGLRPGAQLTFSCKEGKLIATKTRHVSAVSKWRGKGNFPCAMKPEEFLRLVRDGHGD